MLTYHICHYTKYVTVQQHVCKLQDAPQLNGIFYIHHIRIGNTPVIATYYIQPCLVQYLIIFPYVHNPAVHLVNFPELPVDSVPSWRDTSRANLPLACSQPQPRICSLFFQYNKWCGPDYTNNLCPQSCGQLGFWSVRTNLQWKLKWRNSSTTGRYTHLLWSRLPFHSNSEEMEGRDNREIDLYKTLKPHSMHSHTVIVILFWQIRVVPQFLSQCTQITTDSSLLIIWQSSSNMIFIIANSHIQQTWHDCRKFKHQISCIDIIMMVTCFLMFHVKKDVCFIIGIWLPE